MTPDSVAQTVPKWEREIRDLLRHGHAVLVERKRLDGSRQVIPARTHRIATAIELGSRIRPLNTEDR